MNSENVHDLVGAYMLGALTDEEFDRFVAHLDDCDSCAVEILEIQEGVDALAQADTTPLSQDLFARIMAVTEEPSDTNGSGQPVGDNASPQSAGRPTTRRLLALAAGTLVVAGAAAVFVVGRNDSLVDQVEASNDRSTLVLEAQNADRSVTLFESEGVGAVAFVDQDLTALAAGERYALWGLTEDGGARFVGFVQDADGLDVSQAWVTSGDTAGFALSIERGETPPETPSERITYVASR